MTDFSGDATRPKSTFGFNANLLDGLQDEIIARRKSQKAGNGRFYLGVIAAAMVALGTSQVAGEAEGKARFSRMKLDKVQTKADKLAGHGNSTNIAEFVKMTEANKLANLQMMSYLGHTLQAATGRTVLEAIKIETVDQKLKVSGTGQSFGLGQAYAFTALAGELMPSTTATLTNAEKKPTLALNAVAIQFEINQKGAKR